MQTREELCEAALLTTIPPYHSEQKQFHVFSDNSIIRGLVIFDSAGIVLKCFFLYNRCVCVGDFRSTGIQTSYAISYMLN